MKLSNAGQFGQTVSMSKGCPVCNSYGDTLGMYNGNPAWLCKEHWREWYRGDTDWWELIRLVREAGDE